MRFIQTYSRHYISSYLETLGEVLLEVYEEVNQPLPLPLQDLAGGIHSVQSNWHPSSIRSQVSSATQDEGH